MTLEGMAITAVILGIPIALKLVPRGKHAQNINKKAYEYKLKINEIRKIKKKRAVENKLVREQYLSELHSKKREAEYFAEEYYGVWSGDLNQRQIEPFYEVTQHRIPVKSFRKNLSIDWSLGMKHFDINGKIL